MKLVLDPGTPDAADVYAKVSALPAEKPDDVRVTFTSVSDAARRRLSALPR